MKLKKKLEDFLKRQKEVEEEKTCSELLSVFQSISCLATFPGKLEDSLETSSLPCGNLLGLVISNKESTDSAITYFTYCWKIKDISNVQKCQTIN